MEIIQGNSVVKVDYKNVFSKETRSVEQYVYENVLSGPYMLWAHGSSSVYGIALDDSENIFVSDSSRNIILKITSNGQTILWAGKAGQGGTNTGIVSGDDALFNRPGGISVDPSGNLYVADTGNNQIRMVTPDRMVIPIAGSPTGAAGFVNGQATKASFDHPVDVATDADGNIFVADQNNHAIRYIRNGVNTVITVAGDGTAGDTLGPVTSSQLNTPTSVAPLPNGLILIADNGNHKIKMLDTNSNLLRFSGSGIKGHRVGNARDCQYNNLRFSECDPSGNLFIIENMENGQDYILRVDQDGNMSVESDFRNSTDDGIGTSVMGIGVKYSYQVYVTKSSYGLQERTLLVRLYDVNDDLIGEFESDPYYGQTLEQVDISFPNADYDISTIFDADIFAKDPITPPFGNNSVDFSLIDANEHPYDLTFSWNPGYNVLDQSSSSSSGFPTCNATWPLDGSTDSIQRRNYSGTSTVDYSVQYLVDGIRFKNPSIPLGENGNYEIDDFYITVNDGTGVIRANVTSGSQTELAILNGVGDSFRTINGFYLKLQSFEAGTYKISVTSESNYDPMSQIDIYLCEPELIQSRWQASAFYLSEGLTSLHIKIG